MGNLMEMRNKYKDEFEKKHKCRLGFMSAFVKAASAALLEVPAINAVIDDKTDEIVYKNYTDISVAVASPKGLVVPVLRNTQNMSFKVYIYIYILREGLLMRDVHKGPKMLLFYIYIYVCVLVREIQHFEIDLMSFSFSFFSRA
jgi:hypothetical protein